MRESENSIHGQAEAGPIEVQRSCSLLLADDRRYSTWISSHDLRMWRVARAKRRESQVMELRLAATEQIHRAALVRHLRNNQVTGSDRILLLKEFYGPLDSECALLAEHRAYTQAVSSQVCATDLLALSHDREGVTLIEEYERRYNVYFAMHCDRARAISDGRPYLLACLMPEVRANAKILRQTLISDERRTSERRSSMRKVSAIKSRDRRLVDRRSGRSKSLSGPG